MQCHLQRRVSFASVVVAASIVVAAVDVVDVIAVVVVEVILVVVVIIVVDVVAATVQFYSHPFICCLKLKNHFSGGSI